LTVSEGISTRLQRNLHKNTFKITAASVPVKPEQTQQ
jgi:hypothetical protein